MATTRSIGSDSSSATRSLSHPLPNSRAPIDPPITASRHTYQSDIHHCIYAYLSLLSHHCTYILSTASYYVDKPPSPLSIYRAQLVGRQNRPELDSLTHETSMGGPLILFIVEVLATHLYRGGFRPPAKIANSIEGGARH